MIIRFLEREQRQVIRVIYTIHRFGELHADTKRKSSNKLNQKHLRSVPETVRRIWQKYQFVTPVEQFLKKHDLTVS
jgi:hypothetical protein